MILAPALAEAQSLPLYTVARGDNLLRTIDPVTGVTLTSVAIIAAGDTVDSGNGLAIHPSTGEIFALLKLLSLGTPGSPDPRALAIIDPSTGIATVLGSTGDAFAGIAFASDGTLYGVTGDGATTPETLFTLSTVDGSATFFKTLGNGIDGESIAFNPNDGLIYHLSGAGFQNTEEIFETIDPANPANPPVIIPLSVDDFGEIFGFTHWTGDWFIVTSRGSNVFLLNTSGQLRTMSSLDHLAKGVAFGGSAPSCSPLSDLFGAAHQGQDGPSVFYTIDPTDGAATMVGPVGLERMGAMAFDGSGTLFGIGQTMDGTNTTVLATIDSCTGASTVVGNTTIGNNGVPDMSFRNLDGLLSALVTAGTNLNLWNINPFTGAGTPVETTFFNRNIGGGLAYAHDDTLMHADGVNLNSVDPTTAVATLISALNFTGPLDSGPKVNAMDFDPATGVLYAAVPEGDQGQDGIWLATINTTDGTVTVVGDGVTETQGRLDALAFRSKSNLSVVKTAAPTVDFGSDITYTITITNDGPEAVGNARFEDTLDGSLTLVSVTPDGAGAGSCGTIMQTSACSFGGLAVGASDFATIIATTSAEGVVANTADVTDLSAGALDEATPGDNSSTANVDVVTYTVGASPGSSVIKTNTSGTVTVTVTPEGTAFPNAVALSCGAVPAGVTCSFSPTSVDASGGAATSTLTITHAKKIGTFVPFGPTFTPGPFNLFLLGLFGLVGMMLLSLLVFTRRSANARMRRFAPAVILLAGVMLLAACGGAKAVSYSVTVSATSGAITKTTTVNVSTK